MKFHVMTLFPEMIMQGMNTSITGRAMEQNLIGVNAVNIRDYARDKHHKVDDYTYGGGAGMLMQAQPVYDAWESITGGKKVRCVYMTPQGKTFTQSMAREFAKEEELILLCGHYEGIDERVLDEIVTDRVSIGDYVLTGGELPAMIVMDAVSRLIPGVLNNEASAQTESFHNDLLEYPQYSRPEEWHGKIVPDVLLSGNHKNICAWRLEESKKRTFSYRPDLYEKYLIKERLFKQLSRNKRNHIHLMENLTRGLVRVEYEKGKNCLLYNEEHRLVFMHAENASTAQKLLEYIPKEALRIYTCEEHSRQAVANIHGINSCHEYGMALYTQKVSLTVKYKDIRSIEAENPMFGAYQGDKLLGSIAIMPDGSMGVPKICCDTNNMEVSKALVAYLSNRCIQNMQTPFMFYPMGDARMEMIQKELGFYHADTIVTVFGKDGRSK